MQSNVRNDLMTEVKRLADGLKTVIESGTNLACIWLEANLAKIEAQRAESEMRLVGLSAKTEYSGDDLLNTEEAAALLKMPKQTLYWKAERGEIPHGRIGRRYKFSRKALLNHLQSEATEAYQNRIGKRDQSLPKLRKVA